MGPTVSGAEEVIARLRDVSSASQKTLDGAAWEIGETAKRFALEEIRARFRRRTGTMLRHVMAQQVSRDGKDVVWGLPADSQQSIILAHHETGGIVRPRVSMFLRIPLDAAMTAAGVDRFAGVPLRSVSGFFAAKGVLFRRTESGIEPWYALKRSVTHPPRPWWTATKQRLRGTVSEIVRRHVDANVRGKA